MQKGRYLGILIFFSFAFALDTEGLKDWQEKMEPKIREMQEKLKDYKVPEVSQEEKEKLKKQVEEVKKQASQWENRINYDGRRITVGEKTKTERRISLAENEYLYVFMSSSVPKGVWDKYLQTIDTLGIEDRAVLVLRGCIGGCTYIKPTLNFLQSVMKEYKAQVWIDPLLFRRFSISRVPCFVYVKGDELENNELSAGFMDNLKVKGSYMLSCGDWAFTYHLEELCRKGAKTLCELVK